MMCAPGLVLSTQASILYAFVSSLVHNAYLRSVIFNFFLYCKL